MAYTYTVFLVDRRPGGAGIQDVTLYQQEPQGNLRGEARPKTDQKRLYLYIDDPLINIACDDMMEVWAGLFDHDANEWHPTKKPGAGFVIQHTGSQDGIIHIIDCVVAGLGWWASHTAVLSWPSASPDDVPVGFPEDMTVQEWIEGGFSDETGTYPGLIPAHSDTVAMDGIAPALSSFVIPVSSLPGIPMIERASVTGSFDFVYISDALNEIAKAINDADRSKRPLIYWQAKPVGAELVPQLCMIDQNDTTMDVVLTVEASDTPAAGHVVPAQTFKHLRDATQAAQGIIVKGIYGDVTLEGNPLVWWYEHVDDHVNAYPNYHSRRGTWDLIKNERSIVTVAEATRYAQRIETAVWGPRGEISFVLEQDDLLEVGVDLDDVQEGNYLRYIDVVEGIDRVYPINKVTTPTNEIGARYITVTIGFTPLDIADILVGGTADTPWVREGISAAEYARRQVVGAPKFTPPTLTPAVTGQNTISGRWVDVVPLAIKGTAAINPRTGGVVEEHLLTVSPHDIDDVVQPPVFKVTADAVPHPQDYHFGAVSTAGAVPGFLMVRACIIRAVALLGEGAFELTQTTAGSTTSIQTFTNTGDYTVWDLDTPAPYAPGDTIDGVVSGLTGTLYVTVVE